LEDNRRAIDHFLPPGVARQPVYLYRLEKVEELDIDRAKRLQREQPHYISEDGLAAPSSPSFPPRSAKTPPPLELKEFNKPNSISVDLFTGDHQSIDDVWASESAESGDLSTSMTRRTTLPSSNGSSEEDLSRQLMSRLGPEDAPVAGEGRFLLVETKIGASAADAPRFVTEEVNPTEEELVRLVQQRAEAGLLFVSNTFGLATFEVTADRNPRVMLHPLPSDAGVDFDVVLDRAREQALAGWRLRGCLRGRAQIQDFVLGYAMYADVTVTPFSHLFFTLDPAAPRLQLEMVELRGTGNVISGALVRIVRAWARRGWRLSCLVYNLVTTYDKVTLDPPEADGVARGKGVGADGEELLGFLPPVRVFWCSRWCEVVQRLCAYARVWRVCVDACARGCVCVHARACVRVWVSVVTPLCIDSAKILACLHPRVCLREY